MTKRKTMKDLAPIRLQGDEVVEIELQSMPPVSITVKRVFVNKQGYMLEISSPALSSQLRVMPTVSNSILVDVA